MKPVVYILRLCLGAAICGALAGVLGGAVVGVITGLILNNAAFGLDGAFWGGVAGAGVGALYGMGLAVTDSTRPVTGSSPSSSDLEGATTSHPVRTGG